MAKTDKERAELERWVEQTRPDWLRHDYQDIYDPAYWAMLLHPVSTGLDLFGRFIVISGCR